MTSFSEGQSPSAEVKVDCKGAFDCVSRAVTDFFGAGNDKKNTLTVSPGKPGLAGNAADALSKANQRREQKLGI